MKKDLATKTITGCKDVFSDICNVNLFQNERLIVPEELENLKTDSIYTDERGMLREHRQDVRMKHTTSGMDIAIISIENQSDVCNTMPVRDMGYLYTGYQEQIKEIKRKNETEGVRLCTKEIRREQKIVPMISLILYYGTEEWTGPTSILDMLNISEKWKERLEPWIANHQIHIIHLAKQDEK